MLRLIKLTAIFIITTLVITGANAGQVATRVTGSANWNSASTWIQNRTGSISLTNGSASVTGNGTSFTTQLAVGDTIILQASPGTIRGRVASITSNTALTLSAAAGGSGTGT